MLNVKYFSFLSFAKKCDKRNCKINHREVFLPRNTNLKNQRETHTELPNVFAFTCGLREP